MKACCEICQKNSKRRQTLIEAARLAVLPSDLSHQPRSVMLVPFLPILYHAAITLSDDCGK